MFPNKTKSTPHVFQYDLLLKRLGLQEKTLRELSEDSRVTEWLKENADTRYVPEPLLNLCNIVPQID